MTTRTKIILEGEDRTAAAFKSVKSNLGGIGSAASTANRMLAGLGVGLSVGAIAAFISKGVNAAAALGDLSVRTGVAVRELAGLQLMAKQSDTNIETLGKSINKLSVFMAENSGAARQLGLTAKEPLQAFIQLSGILTQIPDMQLRNATANKVLGRSYEELLPALLQGPEALRRQIEQGQRYNGITQEMAEEAKKFKDQLDQLKISTEQLGVNAANNLLPALNDITRAMVEAQKEGSLLKTLWVGLGGLGSFLFTDEFASAEKKIYNIGIEIKTLERRKKEISGGGLLSKLLFGTEEQIDEKITALRKQIEQLKSTVDSSPLPAPVPAPGSSAVAQAACAAIGGVYRNGKCETQKNTGAADYVKGLRDQVAMLGLSERAAELYRASQKGLNAEQMRSVEIYTQKIADQKEAKQNLEDQLEAEKKSNTAAIAGRQILVGLEKNFQAELAKRRRALDAPLLSSGELALAESLEDVAKQAQDARIEIEKLNAQGGLSAEVYSQRLRDVAEEEKKQAGAVRALATEQDKLNASFGYGAKVALRAYLDEVTNVSNTARELVTKSFRGMEDALVDFVKNGKLDFRSLADSIISDLIRISVQQSITGPLASFVQGLFNAKGNAFNSSGVMAFARGGVVNSPTLFPFANGIGLMGEAGPEAILPLQRGPDGRLGVTSAGGGDAVNVTLNISTGVSQTVRAEVMSMMPAIKREVMSAVVDAKKRGGSFGGAFD